MFAGDDDFICYYPMISSIPDVLGIFPLVNYNYIEKNNILDRYINYTITWGYINYTIKVYYTIFA